MKASLVLWLGFLLAILGALLLVVLPVTANLIISLVFWLLGLALLVVSLFAFGAKGKSILMELPLLIKARGYLVATALISAVVLVLEHLGVYTMPLALHLVVQVAALLVLGIGIAKLNLGKSYIESAGTKTSAARDKLAAQVADIKALKSQLSFLPTEDCQKVQQALTEVADALRYSDPVSSPAVLSFDDKITLGIRELSSVAHANNGDEIIKQTKSLLDAINKRNERNRIAKLR